MNAPITITATVGAWLTSTSKSVEDVVRAAETDPQEAASDLGYSNFDMASGSYPWVRVGEAEIKVTLLPREQVASEQIKVLQSELDAERAKWLTAQQAILDRINKLQALTNEVEA
jgi:hypothetical protein